MNQKMGYDFDNVLARLVDNSRHQEFRPGFGPEVNTGLVMVDGFLIVMLVVLRKGMAAAHYVMGGPTANNNNAFSLGTPAAEICVMHGETAAVAGYARRLVKEKDAGRDLQPTIDKMNETVKHYFDGSRPIFCAKSGIIDEIVRFEKMRDYMVAFANAAY